MGGSGGVGGVGGGGEWLRGEWEWAGRWWPGGLAQLGHGPGVSSFSFFSVCFLFCIFFLLFIFFSVLFQFKLFRHFIKICFLYYNYPCNIRHPPNIFVSILKNFYC